MATKANKFSDTVLVIGAGAHVPYGFPTAKILTEKIVSLNGDDMDVTSFSCYHNDPEWQIFKKTLCKSMQNIEFLEPKEVPADSNAWAQHNGRILDKFVIAFAESQVYSIDTFLAEIGRQSLPNDQQYFPKLGKFLIAYFIRYYENKKRVGFSGFDWIQYIISNFIRNKESCEIFFKNPPKIYTFNYDTFLERSLVAHLVRFHGMSEADARG